MSGNYDPPAWATDSGQPQPPQPQPAPPPPPPSWSGPGGQSDPGGYGGYGGAPGNFGPPPGDYGGHSGGGGYGGYGGYTGSPPGGYGMRGPGGPGGGRKPPNRLRRGFVVAVVAAAVGAGSTFLGLNGTDGLTGGTVLTTAQVASKVDPGLVDIDTTLGYQQARAAGTGMVLTSSGEILTNNHVIEGATQITATDIGNGRTYKAKVVGYDRSHDVAVIRLINASGLQTVTLGRSSSATPGQKVVALGNAEGKGGTPSVATGQIISLDASITASDESAGTSEKLTGLIRHNAPIQPGDSGGPLADTSGEVIGMDTAASSSDFQIQGGTSQTQAFSIPIDEAEAIADQIVAGKASDTVHIGATGFAGLQVSSDSNAAANGVPAGSGALIEGVIAGSPANESGLGQGDVITSVDGQHVTSALTLQTTLQGHHPGDKVSIDWTDQSGQSHTATLRLASGPAG